MVTEARIGKRSVSVWSIIAAIGGLCAFIALFMQWLAISDFGGAETFKVSGLDLLSGKLNGTKVSYSFTSILPLIIAILGILTVAGSVLPTFIRKEKEMAIAMTSVSGLALILCLAFLATGLRLSLFTGDWRHMAEIAGLTYSIGIGAVLALIGTMIATVGGVLNIREYR